MQYQDDFSTILNYFSDIRPEWLQDIKKMITDDIHNKNVRGNIYNYYILDKVFEDSNFSECDFFWFSREIICGKFEWIFYTIDDDNERRSLKSLLKLEERYIESKYFEKYGTGHKKIVENIEEAMIFFDIVPKDFCPKFIQLSSIDRCKDYKVDVADLYKNPLYLEHRALEFVKEKYIAQEVELISDSSHCSYVKEEEGFSFSVCIDNSEDTCEVFNFFY